MKKAVLVMAIAATALGVTACSKKAQNEAAEAANTTAADMNTTMTKAVNGVDAAYSAAQNATDNFAASIDNSTDNMSDGDVDTD